VLVLGSRRTPEADLRELSSLRFLTRLGEEIERTRYSERAVWLAALRWLERSPTPEELGRAAQGLRPIDRFCSHAPHIALVCMLECDLAKARALIDGLRRRVGKAAVVAFVSSPPHAFSAEALVAAAVNLVQALAHGNVARGVRYLQRVERDFSAHGLDMFAACAAHAVGSLHPDLAQRGAYSARARAMFERESLKEPERWVHALLPGVLPGRSR
jgi:hypothetical protein